MSENVILSRANSSKTSGILTIFSHLDYSCYKIRNSQHFQAILQSPEKNTHESTFTTFRHIGMTLSCKLVSCKHCFFFDFTNVFFSCYIFRTWIPQPQGLDFLGSNIDTHLLCKPIENRFEKIQNGILVSSLIATNPLKNQFHIFLIEVERVVSLKANLTSDGTT